MKLTATFLFSILSCTAFAQPVTDYATRWAEPTQSALVGQFVEDNFIYGQDWQIKYAAWSLEYQAEHSITPTEYQYFIDDSVKCLGFTLTEAFDYPEPVFLLAHFLYIEAIKHKANMDALDDYLTFIGYAPTLYQDFLYRKMGEFDWAIAKACSDFGWTYNPAASQEAQLKYFATLLLDSVSAWTVDFTAEDTAYRAYLKSIGYTIPDFEMFMRAHFRQFSIWWADVLNDYSK